MIKPGIFKANDIRGITEGSDPEWDAAGAYAIGAALVEVLDLRGGAGALVVGRDMRTSSPGMAAAFIDGVLSRGVNVVDIGLSSTDQLWFASGWLDLPGAMFTASHNPGEYNGIKFCLAGAKPITSAALSRDRRSCQRHRTSARGGTRAALRARPAAGLRELSAFSCRSDWHQAVAGSGRRRQRDGWIHPASGTRR